MAALENLFDESIRKQRITKACGRTTRGEEKEKTAKEAGRRKRVHPKKRPMKKRVDEL